MSRTISDDDMKTIVLNSIQTGTLKKKRELEKAIEAFEEIFQMREFQVLEDERKRDEVERKIEEVEEMYARLKRIQRALDGNVWTVSG